MRRQRAWARTRKQFALASVGIDTAVPDSQSLISSRDPSRAGLDVNYNNWFAAEMCQQSAPLKIP